MVRASMAYQLPAPYCFQKKHCSSDCPLLVIGLDILASAQEKILASTGRPKLIPKVWIRGRVEAKSWPWNQGQNIDIGLGLVTSDFCEGMHHAIMANWHLFVSQKSTALLFVFNFSACLSTFGISVTFLLVINYYHVLLKDLPLSNCDRWHAYSLAGRWIVFLCISLSHLMQGQTFPWLFWWRN